MRFVQRQVIRRVSDDGGFRFDKPQFDGVVISAGAEIKGIRCGCDGSTMVVGEGTANVSVDGVLYTDGGETLMLFPRTRKQVKKIRGS